MRLRVCELSDVAGTVIVAYLLYSGMFSDVETALDFFGSQVTSLPPSHLTTSPLSSPHSLSLNRTLTLSLFFSPLSFLTLCTSEVRNRGGGGGSQSAAFSPLLPPLPPGPPLLSLLLLSLRLSLSLLSLLLLSPLLPSTSSNGAHFGNRGVTAAPLRI